MFEQTFKDIDDVLWKEAGCTERNLASARELFESELNRVFCEGGEGWEEKELVELCEADRIITYGVIKLGDHIPHGVPCLRTTNVRRFRIETDG